MFWRNEQASEWVSEWVSVSEWTNKWNESAEKEKPPWLLEQRSVSTRPKERLSPLWLAPSPLQSQRGLFNYQGALFASGTESSSQDFSQPSTQHSSEMRFLRPCHSGVSGGSVRSLPPVPTTSTGLSQTWGHHNLRLVKYTQQVESFGLGKGGEMKGKRLKQKNIGNPSSLTVGQHEITLAVKPFQIQTQQTGGILPPSS